MPFRVAFIGAGAVNFGEIANKTPWDHASRLEALAKTYPLVFVGIADPHLDKAREQLTERTAGAAPELWAECQIYPNAKDMLSDCRPDAVWVGIPPIVHGSLKDGRNPELQVLQAGAAVFVEKSISCLPLADVMDYSRALTELSMSRNLPISVGYVFRYSKPIGLIKSMLDKHAQGKVACFNAQYNAAYTAIPHRFWWMKSRSGGPIVEQATHFVDLARYICGEVRPESITGLAIGADSPMGQLSSIPPSVEEHTVPAEDRIPRASIVSWRFENGGLGVLNHAALRHGTEYENSIVVWADGLSIEWLHPYQPDKERVDVLIGNSDVIHTYTFPEDDMYATEDEAFLQALSMSKGGQATTTPSGEQGGTGQETVAGRWPQIKSSYADAARTYQLTVQLRESLKYA